MIALRRVAIDSVKVNGRHRKDLGDLGELAASIKEVSLLHPIVLTTTGHLVAGQRRLEACRLLGWKDIPAISVDHLSDARTHLIAERDENTCRKEMAPSEKVALGLALEELEIPSAAERMAQAKGAPRGAKVSSGKLPEQTGHGDVRDLVGAAVGMSGHTYHRAKTVVQAAETLKGEEGRVAREAVEQMDRTGKVTGAYNKIAPLVGRKPLEDGRRPSQPALPDMSTKRQQQRSQAHKERMVAALSGIGGFCRGLGEMDLGLVFAALSNEERNTWAVQAANHGRQLFKLARVLKPGNGDAEATQG